MSTATRERAATEVHPSVAALRAVGLIGSGKAPAGAPRDLSRAHGVWAVTLEDVGDVVVKTAPYTQDDDGPGTLGAELFVHRLALWCEPLRRVLPTPVVVDEAAMVLVTHEVVGPEPNAAFLADSDLAHRLGERTGRVHRATAGLPVPPAPHPHVLAVVHEGTATGVAADLAGHPEVLAAADELRRPAGGCLVHGDLKWSNLAVGADGPVVLDWELAGGGDPAWDVGSLAAEHLVRPGARAGLGPLLTGYAAGARPASRVLPAFSRRVALAAGLRVAQLALEIASQELADVDALVRDVVDRAVGLVLDRAALEREVWSWLAA
ncbi:MAG: phosphotransferase [Cellulomonas sp.]|uniref:phosphotransferase n=1 Tax=Cellulomonas sp. TaxID=40001 RepID=UPI0019E8A33B|nr:phosphotransferase [Cellulomonas sp.]MBF0688129.1 phosphotransferase [Cellulomonas sp.]